MPTKIPPMLIAMAATSFAEKITTHLRETDPEGLKRLLDSMAEGLETALANSKDSSDPRHQVAQAELDLIHRVFTRWG